MKVDIRVEARGRWKGILSGLGMPDRYLKNTHTDCPLCGSGKDRYRFDDKDGNGTYFCAQCGAGDGINLAMKFTGLSFKETTNLIRPNVMNTPLKIVKPVDTQQNEARIKKIHAGLKRITPDSVVALYLAKRGIKVLPDDNCYQHDGVDYYHDGVLLGSFPAMVSIFRTPDGEVSTFHVTYLSADGTKADVPTPRKILPVIKPLVGAAVRLFKAADILGITEGIETALSVNQDQAIPCWAAGSAQAMNNIVIPEPVKVVWIYADSDESFTGQKAAYDLANRLKVKEGKTVRVVTLIDHKSVEDYGVKYDFNDLIIANAAN